VKKIKILIVDDNEAFLELFVCLPGAEEFEIIPLSSGEEALTLLETEQVDLIISDMEMPGMTGAELFEKVQDLYPNIPFIMLTAYGSTENAVQAIQQGAFHYFQKPIDDKLDLLWNTIHRAVDKKKMLSRIESLKKEKLLHLKTYAPIIGNSKEIKSVFQSIKEVADLPVTVLIHGETGTGKELVARAIHDGSQKKDNSFFAVNCSALSPGVLESELFGHERGAFTGALNRKKGIFELSDNGTIFLDEIGEASVILQAKLLRVLETKTFIRVGGASTISSDFRIIAATNKKLKTQVDNGSFRQDLYYRLNVYPIEIPPLKNRKEDIPLIAEYYLQRFSKAYKRKVESISTSALISLRSSDWPGNVRELVNVIERAVITCKDHIITTRELSFNMNQAEIIPDLNLMDVEKYCIVLALKRTNNNKTQASELLGITRQTLIQKVRKYEIENLNQK